MAKLSAIKQDLDLEKDGVWFDFSMGIELKIANANNPVFKDYLKKITKPFIQQIRNSPDGSDIQTRLFKKAAARHLVLDWRNIEDDDGNEVPFSSETCLEYFNDPSLREFYNFVVLSANANEMYRQQIEEESEGN